MNNGQNEPLLNLLNQLLEAEKAGVETLDYLLQTFPETPLEESMVTTKQDEAWSVKGLIAAVKREGGNPSKETGDFTGKVKALITLDEKVKLLIKGQSWVARKIDEALTYEMNQETEEFLIEMKKRHLQNIAAIQ